MLVKALFLGAPFALFLVLFDLRFARLNPSDVGAKKILLERQGPRIEALVLGSSHELTGIDPTALGAHAFNLAGQSQSLYYDIGLLKKYRPLLPSLKLVILPVSYFSLEYELEDAPEQWRSYHYTYFHGLPHQDWHKVISARNLSAYFLAGESTRARVAFGTSADAGREYDSWGGWTNRPCDEYAGVSPNTISNSLARAAAITLKTHHSMMKPRHLPANIQRLEQVMQELKHDGIAVVLVTLPVSRYYGQGVHPEAYQRMQTALEQLTEKCQVPYRNYMFDRRFADTDFRDGDHLNCAGARKFTQLFRSKGSEHSISNLFRLPD